MERSAVRGQRRDPCVRTERRLEYSHYSPISNKPDRPENYHTVTYNLSESDGKTIVSLSQDNNPDKETFETSTQNWQTMLDGLKPLKL